MSLSIFLNHKTESHLVLMLHHCLKKTSKFDRFYQSSEACKAFAMSRDTESLYLILKSLFFLIENMVLGYHCFCERGVELNKNQTAYSVADRACSFIVILSQAEWGRSTRSKEVAKCRFISPYPQQLGCHLSSHLGLSDPFHDLDNFSIASSFTS